MAQTLTTDHVRDGPRNLTHLCSNTPSSTSAPDIDPEGAGQMPSEPGSSSNFEGWDQGVAEGGQLPKPIYPYHSVLT